MENEKLTYINSRGERLELGVDSVYHCNISKDVEGISGVTSVIYSTNSMGQHGDTYVGQRIEARDIDVVGHINTRDKAQALELRRRMLKIFNPELSATLVYEYGGFKRVIDCRAYGEPKILKKEVLYEFDLQIECFNPFWREEEETKEDIASWVAAWHFPCVIEKDSTKSMIYGYRAESVIVDCYNEGDVSTGMRIRFTALGRLRTMEEWTKTAEDMMRAGTLFVLLTGGEPLLYPHFRELYQKLRELGMIITINTNGTLIDEAWADFFAENKPRRINITLYGASNETYERLCHYPGGFDKAVNGIRLLRERNIDVKVNGSLAKANVDDRMKIIELGESLDAPVRIDTYMYPSVRERNHAYNNQARLDPEMAAKARVEVLRREMGEEVFAQYRKIQLDEAENTPEGEAVPGQMTCRAGKSSFVVNWQGEMRSCVVLDKPSIPLRDVEFEEAWKFTKKETESLRISARCSSCKLRKVCNTCVAAAIAETGKADGVPEYLCRYTEATVRYLKETSKK